MDCKNFDALDDMCRGCLSGGTSGSPREEECYEEPIRIAAIKHGKQFEIEEVKEAIKLIGDYCRSCFGCDDCDNEIRKWCQGSLDDIFPEDWDEVIN